MTKLLLLPLLTAMSLAAAGKDSCVQCHANLDGDLQTPAVKFPAKDIHAQAGLSCTDCHGGDHTTDDFEASMSKARGFLGKIPRLAIPKTCARCHSDATVMHKYQPTQRVDQRPR